MLLMELYEKGIPGFVSDQDDSSRPKWGESRKTKLTLRQIRKLRKMLDVRSVETRQNIKKVQMQYKPKADPNGGPM
jgi:hypothetical protein